MMANQMVTWRPTMDLRWIQQPRKNGRPGNFVLHQRWQSNGGTQEWRPIEIEKA